MDFKDTYKYADEVYSMNFAGNKLKVDWTDEDMKLIDLAQIYGLLGAFTPDTRKLHIS